jgi:hypothetical protein
MIQRRLVRLHLLARGGDQGAKLTKGGPVELESGNWSVPADIAEQAVGAEVHLHEKQTEKSWKAGRIVALRASDDWLGRFVFRFLVPNLARTQRSGWGMEQARVWEEEEA